MCNVEKKVNCVKFHDEILVSSKQEKQISLQKKLFIKYDMDLSPYSFIIKIEMLWYDCQ